MILQQKAYSSKVTWTAVLSQSGSTSLAAASFSGRPSNCVPPTILFPQREQDQTRRRPVAGSHGTSTHLCSVIGRGYGQNGQTFDFWTDSMSEHFRIRMTHDGWSAWPDC